MYTYSFTENLGTIIAKCAKRPAETMVGNKHDNTSYIWVTANEILKMQLNAYLRQG